MLLTLFKGERISKFNTVLNLKVFPSFSKEGLGEIYQSVIMKVRLTDQHSTYGLLFIYWRFKYWCDWI